MRNIRLVVVFEGTVIFDHRIYYIIRLIFSPLPLGRGRRAKLVESAHRHRVTRHRAERPSAEVRYLDEKHFLRARVPDVGTTRRWTASDRQRRVDEACHPVQHRAGARRHFGKVRVHRVPDSTKIVDEIGTHLIHAP